MISYVTKLYFSLHSVALDESTDKTVNAQLAIFIRGINDQFEVTEELLSLCHMHDSQAYISATVQHD